MNKKYPISEIRIDARISKELAVKAPLSLCLYVYTIFSLSLFLSVYMYIYR